MPKVPQLDWSKLRPKQPEIRSIPHYHTPIQPKVRPKKHERTKIKDKRLFNDEYDHQQHLKQIMLE